MKQYRKPEIKLEQLRMDSQFAGGCAAFNEEERAELQIAMNQRLNAVIKEIQLYAELGEDGIYMNINFVVDNNKGISFDDVIRTNGTGDALNSMVDNAIVNNWYNMVENDKQDFCHMLSVAPANKPFS